VALAHYPPPQEDVIRALIKEANKLRDTKYVVVARPDVDERNRTEVDYILRDDSGRPEIAVEVSTAWRSEQAGKEDDDWAKWIEAVRTQVSGRLRANFRVSTPLRIPVELDATTFAEQLIAVLDGEHDHLAALYNEGKSTYLTVCGARVFVTYVGDGSAVSFGRILPEGEAKQAWREHVERMVAKKTERLRRHKSAGRETWLVMYNTFWTAMSITGVRDAVRVALRPEHRHIDHVAIVAGNPPDDAWVDIIR